MLKMLPVYIITNLLVILGILVLILLLISKKGLKPHFWFIIFSASLMFWVGLQFFAQIFYKYGFAPYLVKAAMGIITLVAVSFYGFVDQFLGLKSNTTSKKILLLLSAVFLSVSLTDLIAQDVSVSYEGIAVNSYGLIYLVLLLYCVALVGISLYRLIKRYWKLSSAESSAKKGVVLLFFGMLQFTVVIALASMFLSKNKVSQILAPISSLLFIAFVFYAIFKHSLFNIRMFVARSAAYSFTILIIIAFYTFILFWSTRFMFGIDVKLIVEIYFSSLTVLAALTFQPLKRYFDKYSNKIFYRDAYDAQKVLDQLSDSLLAENDIDSMMRRSIQIIQSALKPSTVYLAVLNTSGVVYKHMHFGREENSEIVEAILNRLPEESSIIIDRQNYPHKSIAGLMSKEDVEILLRLGPRTNPTGLLLLGPKQSGEIYGRQDLSLLKISAKNLGIALDNAKKYEQILHFADTLHKEVKRATSRLRKANVELKTLDALKDDFIATASHQLRTPSASVHDALRLLNHPGISKKDRDELIALAEASSEHLVTVVRTMLNMARIQAGHFTIDKSEAGLIGLIEKVLDQVKVLAEEKGSKLEFIKPNRPIMQEVDVAKINEALSNYIENAIKYSPDNSTITVSLMQAADKVYFEVTDQGMGVPEEERKNLFGKFYRASNARQEQPDGNGIGLYVVKNIAEGHGGEAYYRPAETHGSIFGFWIPATKNN